MPRPPAKTEITIDLRAHRIKKLLALISWVLAVAMILAYLEKAGRIGAWMLAHISSTIGIVGYSLPLLAIYIGSWFWKHRESNLTWRPIFGLLVTYLGLLPLAYILTITNAGVLGTVTGIWVVGMFDVYLGTFLALTTSMVGIAIIPEGYPIVRSLVHTLSQWIERILNRTLHNDTSDTSDSEEQTPNNNQKSKQDTPEESSERAVERKPSLSDTVSGMIATRPRSSEAETKKEPPQKRIILPPSEYIAPPLNLLRASKEKPEAGDVKENALIIQRTLRNFDIGVEMDEISIGPSITRFALRPSQGLKLARIVALRNELSLALAAHPIRIEAPIPGKSLVGIEIPNRSIAPVGLGGLLAEPHYQDGQPLTVALGKGVSGKSHFANIAKMPHLLIAGATGSGKSVTAHNIILSLIYRNGPDRLRLMLVDPKRVELTLYNNIPHLLTPVIKDAKKTIIGLRWATKEMERRYNVLEKYSVRDIDSYHQNIVSPAYAHIAPDADTSELPERMPYIVILIDELADIMQAYPRELESGIVRLAQMSRAVGIHLILSTQRPSVNIITGLIKANIPARLALKVSSQIDSRTILDASGAETLLGKGDMLYRGGEMSKPERIQCAMVTEDEVKAVVARLIKDNREIPPDQIELGDSNDSNDPDSSTVSGGSFDDSDDDTLYEEAKDLVIRTKVASTSYIQRKLRVGYSRAARLVDLLEERGVIGPANGSKPREVYSTPGTPNHQPDTQTIDSYDEIADSSEQE